MTDSNRLLIYETDLDIVPVTKNCAEFIFVWNVL